MLRLIVSALLGSLVGLERERGEWAAGLRTHMLVSTGACLFMIVSAYGFSGVLGRTAVVLDPSRVGAQVVTGVGFLGAGTILLREEVVRGLTTAASLWAVAAVGLASGGGLFREAAATTLLVVVILAGIKPLERHFFQRKRTRTVVVHRRGPDAPLSAIEDRVVRSGHRLVRVRISRTDAGDERVELRVAGATPEAMLALTQALMEVRGVQDVQANLE